MPSGLNPNAIGSVVPIMSGGAGGGAAGFTFKAPCRLASTANLALAGLVVVDGVATVAGDRILVKDQAAPADNGIYVAAAGAWARSADFNTSAEAVPSCIVPVSEGATQADTLWMLTTDAPITLGVTPLTFSPFGAVGVDHFGPTIIVGNTVEGDPAAAFPAPFQYFPDTGNGAGIAAAFAAAAASGVGAWVHIRRGTYDLGAVGAPALPLAIAGFRVSGDGDSTRIRMSTLDRRVFVLTTVPAISGRGPELFDLGIDYTTAAPGAVGTVAIECGASFRATLSNIDLVKGLGTFPPPGPVINADESLTSVFRGGPSTRFLGCRAFNVDGTAGLTVVAFRLAGFTATIDSCAVAGSNIGYRAEAAVQSILGSSISGGVIFASCNGIEVATTFVRVNGCQVGSVAEGLVVEAGADGIIDGNNLTGVTRAIRVDAAAGDTIVTSNRFNGDPTSILSPSAEVGHNIL